MPVALTLILLALGVATLTPRLLSRGAWAQRSPRTGIIAWQASVLTVLSACILLALTALVPVARVSFDIGHLLHACPELLRRQYTLMDDSWLHLVSLLIAGVTLTTLVVSCTVRGISVRRGRVRQRLLLDLLVNQRDHHGAHVLEHDLPLAYCVPGGGGRVVVTTGAVSALDDRQLRAVLAHEHAHLDGRHDLVLFGADVAASAFPWSRFFRIARRELATLIEMLADDEASRRSDRDSLARALVGLGQVGAPEGAVGASGDTLARVQRLLHAAPSLSLARRSAVAATACALVATPWVIAIAPAWAARSGLCPIPGA